MCVSLCLYVSNTSVHSILAADIGISKQGRFVLLAVG